MNGALQQEPDGLVVPLAAVDKRGVLAELSARLAGRHPGICADGLLRLLLEREALGSTGIGDGVAIPHCKYPSLKAPVLLFGRSDAGIDFNAVDGRLVHLFFLLVVPEGAAGQHLKLLARLSRLLKEPSVRSSLMTASTSVEIFSVVKEQDRRQ